MKLDFETNLSHVSPADKASYDDGGLENSPNKISAQFQAGVKAAFEGNRAEARFLLSRVVEAEPDNEGAWMQLASVSEYPEELIGFLSHVLRINPNNERAAEWTKSTKNLLSQKFVQRGTEALENARKMFAKQCFLQAIAHDEENETAWLQMAAVADSVEEKTAHLEKVLRLNPKNEKALASLQPPAQQTVEQLLQKAVTAAIAGERGETKPLLDEILNKAPKMVNAWILKSFLVESFEEKIECFEKILDIDDENELANVNWTALLDIMAKAETKKQPTGAEQISVIEKNGSHDSKPAFISSESNKSFSYVSPLTDEDSEAVQPDFAVQSSEKEVYFNEEAAQAHQLGAENEKSFTDFKATDEENEFFEESAQNYSDYSMLELSEPQKVAEDLSLTNGELSISHEPLPSYYENREDVAAPLETVENDYSKEFEQTETNAFEQIYVKPEDAPPVFQEESEEDVFSEDVSGAESFVELQNEMVVCPFCGADQEAQAFVCDSCHTMLTLSDLEMLLAHQGADQETLRGAVERMEAERNRRDFDVEDLKLLALGQINLKNLRQGCAYLNEAAQMNPNDVFLGSQVNFLKIRLAEIEEQQSLHDSMPKNRKILVVDDSATVRKLISGKLEKSGHEVFSAVDGVDALEKIKEFVPDLILLDINMPRMDGYQVCKLIRGNEATKDVPIVMISGKDGFFDKVRGRMAGTTGYITKPFGPETLMKMLDTYIVQNGKQMVEDENSQS